MISDVGFDEKFGARPIKRAIQDKIEDLISEKILLNEVIEGGEYVLLVKGKGEEKTISLEDKPKRKSRKKKED